MQTDVKSALISGTQTQVGLMFLTCGLGWFELAAWHLAAHAGWRAYQLLSAPAYMHLLDGFTTPVRAGLQRHRGLFAAALARFWLDPLTDLLITRPSQAMARDLQSLDDRLVNRLMGDGAMEQLLFGQSQPMPRSGAPLVTGRGLPGALLEQLAQRVQWVEERILSMGGAGMVETVAGLGSYLLRIDRLLGEPRYLVLMIVLTFVAVL
ncbi:MAG: hypothetical protein H7838_05510 [Magnetococcus sp. DMHC-8]